MRCAANIETYLSGWRDAYVIERDFCAFHRSPDLFGLIVWGRPDVSQARAITRARGAELDDPEVHRVILDYRLVEAIDQDAFRCMGEWLDCHRDVLAQRTSRAALVHPSEPFAAAIAAGFYRVVTPPYPSRLCASLEEADAWLGPPTADTVKSVHDLCSAGRPTVSLLVRLLERFPTLDIESAASELTTTPRTLQRRLRDEGTTFREEVRKAIVRKAKILLANTDGKVADIAASVGCASAQHFTQLFREELGVSPAVWRRQVRGEPGDDQP